MKPETLTEKLYEVFSKICENKLSDKTIAEAFAKLRAEGKQPEDIKLALLRAGDLENSIPKNVYTRNDLKKIFNWEERALKENLEKWGLPTSSRIPSYSKESIHKAAEAAGWREDKENGAWIRPRKAPAKNS
jgi:hypothetical protein